MLDAEVSPTINDLKLEIGQVQVCWSFLEAEIRKQLVRAGLQEQVQRGSIILHWRSYLKLFARDLGPEEVADHLNLIDRLALQRNLIAHGIKTLSIDSDEKTAVIVCAAADGTEQTFTLKELKELSAEISTAQFRLPRVTASTNVTR